MTKIPDYSENQPLNPVKIFFHKRKMFHVGRVHILEKWGWLSLSPFSPAPSSHFTNLFMVVASGSSTRASGATTWFLNLKKYQYLNFLKITIEYFFGPVTCDQKPRDWMLKTTIIIERKFWRWSFVSLGTFSQIPTPFNALLSQYHNLWRKMAAQPLSSVQSKPSSQK